MGTYAKVIADSISPEGVRLTTFEVCFHRFVLAEFNTHRVFSRNSASSRAIPLAKQIQRIQNDLAMPVSFPAEQKGMQGGEELDGIAVDQARSAWVSAANWAVVAAEAMGRIGVHKSIANRLLEPFMWHTVVVTSTSWENFFAQRCSPLAQPEIRVAAEMMREAYEASEPQDLSEDQWHAPYFDWDHDDDRYGLGSAMIEAGAQVDDPSTFREWAARVSAARCARVSYLTQDGRRDIQADLDLYERLVTAKPPHWSPLEHVATPWAWNRQEGCIHFGQTEGSEEDDFTCIPLDHLPRVGNLLGWRSLRTTIEAERGEVTYR